MRMLLWVWLCVSFIGASASAGLWVRSYFLQDFLIYHWPIGDVAAPWDRGEILRSVNRQMGGYSCRGQLEVCTGFETQGRTLGWEHMSQAPWSEEFKRPMSWPDRLGFRYGSSLRGTVIACYLIRVPLWFVCGAFLALGAYPFHTQLLVPLKRRSRRRRARCVRCGYDLRATPGRCPECGVPAT